VATTVGTVRTLRRFPVKSMLGEEPTAVDIDASGIVGDRAWALVDVETGKVASAKHPRLWASLLELQAGYVNAPGVNTPGVDSPSGGSAVRIRLRDGSVVHSGDEGVDARLTEAAGRAVRLVGAVPPGAVYDEEWPDVAQIGPAQIAPPEFVAATSTGRSAEGRTLSSLPVGMMAPGTFQDVAPLTLMTTASLRAARALHPDGDWDDRRFRSTILIDTEGDGFVEQGWVGRHLVVGDVELDLTAPTPRCVMVTLPRQGMSSDPDVLRTLARHNRVDVLGSGLFACLGVYASVVRPGRVATGDAVTLL
jgi:uncharacterized protein